MERRIKMKDSKLFDKVLSNEDLKKVVLDNTRYLIRINDADTIIESFNNLLTNKDDRLMEFAHTIDSDFALGKNDNAMHKIPTLLVGCVFLDKYRDDIEQIDNSQLGLLSNFSSFFNVDEYDDNIKLYNKDILESICKRSSDYHTRFDLLCLVEDKFFEFGIDRNSLELEDFQKKMSGFVSSLEDNELFHLIREYDKKVQLEIEKSGVRI